MTAIWLAVAGWVRGEPPLTAAAFAPGGELVLLGSQRGIETYRWPEMSPAGELPTRLQHVHDLKFSLDGARLLAAGGQPGERGVVEQFNWPGRRLERAIDAHGDLVYRVAWLGDEQWVTAGADGQCRVFDLRASEPLCTFAGHSRAVLGVARVPGGNRVVSAGADQTLRLWSAVDGSALRTLDNHLAAVNDVSFRPQPEPAGEPVVATAGEDRTVRLWQPAIGRMLRFAKLASAPRCLEWSPGGDRLYAGCSDGQIRVLDPETVEELESLACGCGRIHALLVDEPRRRLLAAGEDGWCVVRIPR